MENFKPRDLYGRCLPFGGTNVASEIIEHLKKDAYGVLPKGTTFELRRNEYEVCWVYRTDDCLALEDPKTAFPFLISIETAQ